MVPKPGRFRPERIGLLHSREPQEEVARPSNPHGHVQRIETIRAVRQALVECGYQVVPRAADEALLSWLRDEPVDLIFNLATGIHSKQEQAHVVAMLETSGVPFTGSPLTAHVLGLHKPLAKKVFRFHGISTAPFQVFEDGNEPLDPGLSFPLIVKPSSEGSSVGITTEGVVTSEGMLREVVERLLREFRQPVLVEEFIRGREFTLGILGNRDAFVLPIEEIIFNGSPDGFYSYHVKERDAVTWRCPADVGPPMARRLEALALLAFRSLGCRDFARMDVRVDEAGRPHALEINTLPGLMPNYSDFPRMAEAAGIAFPELVDRIVSLAWSRR